MASIEQPTSPAPYEHATLADDDDLIDFHSDSDEPNALTSESYEADTPSTSSPIPAKPATKYVNPIALTRELYELEQTASVDEYAEKVETYIKQLNYPMSMAVGYFRNGLKPEIAERLEASPITDVYSYNEVKATAIKIEAELGDATLSSSPHPDASSAPGPDVALESAPKDEKETTGELTSLIPTDFKTTPGLSKPLLWHAAIKYIDSLTGSSTLTPFDVFDNPQPLAEYKDVTRTILQRMIPTSYHPSDVDLNLEPARYIAHGAVQLIKRYPVDGGKYTVSKTAANKYSKTQEELREALEAQKAVAGRKIAKPKSQKKAQPAPAPAPAAKPSVSSGPIALRTRGAKALRSDPLAKARLDVRRELNKTTPAAIDWEDSASVIVHTEQRIAELTEALDQLKAAIRKPKKN